MKKLILLALLFSIGGFSQTNGKIYFKNGNIFEGAIAKKNSIIGSTIDTKIVYSPEKGKKLTKGSFEIDKVELLSDKNNEVASVFYYKEVKNRIIFMEKISSKNGLHIFKGHNAVGVSDLVPGFSKTITDFKVYEEYYFGKNDGSELTTFHNRISSKKFNSQITEYFGNSKCEKIDDIIKKYQKNKKLKKRELFNELNAVCN